MYNFLSTPQHIMSLFIEARKDVWHECCQKRFKWWENFVKRKCQNFKLYVFFILLCITIYEKSAFSINIRSASFKLL